MIDERLRQLYTDLQREYDLVLDRRKTLTGQATSIMSFAGIIETVLIGLLISFGTDEAIKQVVSTAPFSYLLLLIIGIGFSSYILTAVFSLFAFWEKKWIRVPRLPDPDPLKSIDDFFSDPNSYDLKMFAYQLSSATERHQIANNKKYDYLRIALLFLLIGIVFTVILGFILLRL